MSNNRASFNGRTEDFEPSNARSNRAARIEIVDINLIAVPKSHIDRKKVEQHKRDIDEGKEIVPIRVREFDYGYLIDGNGRHRFVVLLELGFKQISVNLD